MTTGHLDGAKPPTLLTVGQLEGLYRAGRPNHPPLIKPVPNTFFAISQAEAGQPQGGCGKGGYGWFLAGELLKIGP